MRLLEWYRQRDLKKIQAQSQTAYTGFESSKSYLLFYQYSQLAQAEVSAWEALLKEEGKIVDCIALCTFKEKEVPHDIYPQYIRAKESTWWGKPKGEVFIKALEKKYDVFIDLSSGDHIAAKYLRYGSHAALKVNFGHQKKPWSDLQLDFKLKEQGPAARAALLKLLAFINK